MPSPIDRSRKALEGVNVRQVLEASNMPVEIATRLLALADRLDKRFLTKSSPYHAEDDVSLIAEACVILQDIAKETR